MRSVAAPVLFFSLAAVCAAQSLTITSKVTRDDGTTTTRTSYVTEDRVRTAVGDSDIIFDSNSGDMITIDNNKKTYHVTTKKDFETMAETIRQKMNSPEVKQAQEQMKNMPPEQRKRMEAAMQSMFAVDIHDLGTSNTIAGYKCENWVVNVGPSKTEECLTTDLKLPIHSWDLYRTAWDTTKSMMSAMGPMAPDLTKMQEQMKKMKGLPLTNKTTMSFMGRTRVTSSEVTDIRKGPVPASAFDIPAGYTKVESPMRKGMRQ